MNTDATLNRDIADAFDEIADLLEARGANTFRVRSYRRGARELRALDESVDAILEEGGRRGLQEIPGIGEGLSGAIAEYVDSGQIRMLERLRTEVSPQVIFEQLPGVGPKLAERIHTQLGIETLEELERAAHDGRLEAEVDQLGPEKAAGIRDALAGMLSRAGRQRARARTARSSQAESPPEPPVDLILELDRTYRQKAKNDELRRIAPRRFNPEGKRWLPIMETERQGWDFTLLFSNTERAHELGKTHDWVVIYYERDGKKGQCTVVTASSGALDGKRVVRGREAACREYYERRDAG